MTIRRTFCLLAALLLCLTGAQAYTPPALREEIYGKQALLYCAETGQTLFEQDADTPVPPASVTKLMTALVVLEQVPDLSITTTVSETAVDIERDSTNIALTPGEQVTLEQMLYATLMQSANDAANVLAEYVGGSQEAFAARMNARAETLGCTGSHFANAHGLDADDHRMTARDIARIAAALLEDARFLEIERQLMYTMEPTNKQPEPRVWYTKQRMLRANSAFYNPYVIAGKNGYTTNAQHTQCTIARKDGMTLIAVSLGSSGNPYYPWRDMRTLFALGLDGYRLVNLSGAQVAERAHKAGLQAVSAEACSDIPVVVPAEAGVDNLSLSPVADAKGRRTLQLTWQDETSDWMPLPYVLGPDAQALQQQADAAPTAAPDRTQPLTLPDINLTLVFYAALAVVVLYIVIFVILWIRRARRIRRRRKQIAAMRRAAAKRTADQLPSASDPPVDLSQIDDRFGR